MSWHRFGVASRSIKLTQHHPTKASPEPLRIQVYEFVINDLKEAITGLPLRVGLRRYRRWPGIEGGSSGYAGPGLYAAGKLRPGQRATGRRDSLQSI